MKKITLALFLILIPTAFAKETIDVKVKGLVCSFCAQGIEKKFKANPAVEKVSVSLEKKHVVIGTKENSKLSDEEIKKSLEDSGYNVEKIERKSE